MLVIRRRASESFLIGDQIEVEILELAQNQVKVGIRAPRALPILRREIWLSSRVNEAAGAMPTDAALRLAENLRR
jgi:carbon storage regulator